MIAYLKGRIILSKTGFLILECNGVGYKIATASFVDLQKDSIEMFIHEHLREDAADLYGFLTYPELELFEKLISVNGVGPKAGLNIMSSGQPERIIQAIICDDIGFFLAISGIGKKVAAKIILELKSKLSGDKNINILGSGGEELIDALSSLGYKPAEISAIAAKIPADLMGIEAKIKWALKNLAR